LPLISSALIKTDIVINRHRHGWYVGTR